LKILDPGASRQLLAKSCNVPASDLPQASVEILKECNGLPLALDMIGKMLRGKPPDRWEGVVEDLRASRLEQIKIQSPEYAEHNNLWAVVDVSVKDLETTVQARYLDLAVFPDDASIPEKTLATFWGSNGVIPREAKRIVDDLHDRALLLSDAQNVK